MMAHGVPELCENHRQPLAIIGRGVVEWDSGGDGRWTTGLISETMNRDHRLESVSQGNRRFP